MTDRPIRASDKERESVVDVLRDAYTDGRLTLEEFEERTSAAYASKTWADLRELTADLPVEPVLGADLLQRQSMPNPSTGSGRVIPDQQPPREERGPRLARLTRPAVTHWQFTIVLAAAVVIRIIVILGYPPILWFNDSYNYIYDAVTHIPDA